MYALRHRRHRVPFCLTALSLMVAAGLGAPPGSADPVPYAVRLEGVDDPAILGLLESVSDTVALVDQPPASVIHLRRRASRDRDRFLDVLRAEGHYGAAVEFDLDPEALPAQLIFTIVPGPQYNLGVIQVTGTGPHPLAEADLPGPEVLQLEIAAPARAQPIVRADELLLNHLRTRGYPAPVIVRRDVLVRHGTRTVDVTWQVDAGAPSVFGEAYYEGLERVRPQVIDRLLPWQPGASFDYREIDALRNRLYATQLFSTVSIKPGKAPAASAAVPIEVTVVERPHRTIATGLEYNTGEGAGAQFSWEHRNIRGLGHRLAVDAKLATEQRSLGARYRIDRYRRNDQALTLSGELSQEDRDAYESSALTALAFVERTVSPRLTLGAGVGLRFSQVTQQREDESHALLYWPLEARFDHTNDPLDPTRGYRLATRLEPWLGVGSDKSLFLKSGAEFSAYLPLGSFTTLTGKTVDDWVLAWRLHLGMTTGASSGAIPADIRFYAGGGGSVRGYPYRTVGPLERNDPVGGRSLLETSIEMRKRITEKIGVAAFIDGGSAFDASWPDFSEDLRWSAGLGLRIFTALGPIRVDAAIPLNRRKGLDDAYQLYLSIGQAF